MVARKGSKQIVRGRLYGLFWLGGKRRESVPMPGVDQNDEPSVQRRCEVIADLSDRLVAAGRSDRARDFANLLGAATSQKRIALITQEIDEIVRAGGGIGTNVTVKDFGDRWTSGRLAASFPDHVKTKRSAKDDERTLAKYVYPVIGAMPLRAVRLEDAERVMAGVPTLRSRARRRHVAQVLSKLLKFAVYPAKIIPVYPLPTGFLPKLGPGKAQQYLYPDEDRALLKQRTVALDERLLFGTMAREGFRLSEGLALTWDDIDLVRGVVRLDENKTRDPRSWVLDEGVRRALVRWKEMGLAPGGPFKNVGSVRATRFRDEYLKAAGVVRPDLFVRSDARKPICVHDLRATFVTISLANGKTETWVQDRTGHRSTLMIARYRRAARTVAELALGPLSPLDEAIDWAEEACQTDVKHAVGGDESVLAATPEKKPRGPSGTRTRTPLRAADFKTEQALAAEPPGVESQEGGHEAARGDTPFDSRLTTARAPVFSTYIKLDPVRRKVRAIRSTALDDEEIARRFDIGVRLARDGRRAESDMNLRQIAALVAGGAS